MLATFLSTCFSWFLASWLSIFFTIECSVREVKCITPVAVFSTKFNNADPFNFRSLRGKESRIRFIRLQKLIKCYLVCSWPLAGSHLSQSIAVVLPRGPGVLAPALWGGHLPAHVFPHLCVLDYKNHFSVHWPFICRGLLRQEKAPGLF